jgi:hypothetical protein
MMSDERQVHRRDDVVFIGLSLLAWFFGPIRWVVQANSGLTEVDLHTHLLSFKEYGFQFVLALGVFNVLYLSSPYLWVMWLKLYRHARQRVHDLER